MCISLTASHLQCGLGRSLDAPRVTKWRSAIGGSRADPDDLRRAEPEQTATTPSLKIPDFIASLLLRKSRTQPRGQSYSSVSARRCRTATSACAARPTARIANRRRGDGVTLGSCPREIDEGDPRLCGGRAERRGAMAKRRRYPAHCWASQQRHPAAASHFVLPA